MKKILIIGNQGMLGQQLEKIFLTDSNYEVTGWDKDKIDITNESQTREKIFELKPQIIINAAAYNNDPEFYAFIKTLETYKNTINKDTTLMLTTENEFL